MEIEHIAQRTIGQAGAEDGNVILPSPIVNGFDVIDLLSQSCDQFRWRPLDFLKNNSKSTDYAADNNSSNHSLPALLAPPAFRQKWAKANPRICNNCCWVSVNFRCD